MLYLNDMEDERMINLPNEFEKIEANNLNKYYASEGKSNNTKMGIVWITLSIVGVVIILFAIKKRE